ncbi:MAG: glutathione S-transferase C-terminal domain-containing protein [Klebsiella pneumoniae]|nr:glutathione S-transferase C-terminal domain-containing protein [Klebsiella pneumoniae]
MITLWGRNNSTNVKKVRWVLEELDLPYQQILAGLEFGLNHDPEYLAMNPNGLVPPAHRPVLMGLVRTPPEQRDPAAIAAGISACEALFAMLDDELAKTPWLSGEQFGLGDIAVAPFVYNLLSILDSWQPRPHLQRWYQQISQRPAWCEVVQIPVT